MEVMTSYKHTELGLIPENWEIKSLWEIGMWKGGATPSMSNPNYWNNGTIPWASSGDIKVNLLSSTTNKITEMAVKNSSTTLIPQGSVLIVTRSGILRRYLPVAKNITQVAINQDIKALIPNRQVDVDYLLQVLLAFGPQILGRCLKSGTTVESIEFKWLKNFIIALPPLVEQQAIAEALSDADALIDSLEQLIAKKRQVKQGAMQELLTGKRRLPGFDVNNRYKQSDIGVIPENWSIGKLPNYVWYQEGPGVRNYQFTDSGVKLFNGTNIENGKIILEKTSRYISEREAYGPYAHFLADPGDIVIASSGVSVDRFHEKVAVLSTEHLPLCMNTSTIRFKVTSTYLFDKYLIYFFKSQYFKDQISDKATGSAQLNFGPAHIKTVQIPLPEMTEQIAIVAILSDMDDEISILGNKLAKARQIKQGMMQELLTGRIRLIKGL